MSDYRTLREDDVIPTNLQQSIKVSGDGQPASYECFCDESYYGLWAVRPKGETRWGHCYHLHNREEAEALCSDLDRLRAELGEAREQLKAEQRLADSNGKACLNLRRQIVALYQRVDVQEVAKLKKEVAAANKGAERTYRINSALEKKLSDLRTRLAATEKEIKTINDNWSEQCHHVEKERDAANKRVKELEAKFQELSECEFTFDSCASLDIASARIRTFARQALETKGE